MESADELSERLFPLKVVKTAISSSQPYSQAEKPLFSQLKELAATTAQEGQRTKNQEIYPRRLRH